MFSKSELAIIRRALDLAAASAKRLSLKEGQPAEVQAAYLKAMNETVALATKVAAEEQKAK